MLTGLLHLHSGLRWIVVLLAIITLVRLVMLMQSGKFKKSDNTLLKIFTILFDIQVLVGIIFFIVWAVKSMPLEAYHWEHAVSMILAAGVFHMSAKYKKAAGKARARYTLLFLIAALLLIVIGVALLPQGWSMAPSMV